MADKILTAAEKDQLIADMSARLARLEEAQQARESETVGAQAMSAAEIAEISATAAAAAHQKVNQWWDDRVYPEKSPFNPLGERLHPKAKLTREMFLCGTPLNEDQLTPEEIEALNAVQPGLYDRHNPGGQVAQGGRGFFKVREMDPGLRDGRIMILFPFKGDQAHATLRQYDRGRGMVDLLLEMTPKVRLPEPVGV